jgi:predicted DNA-binding mobile mystery protein A
MQQSFRDLRIEQLQRALRPFLEVRPPRPRRGWIHAMRVATGLTLRELAQRMGKSLPLAAQLERSEGDYRITLASLRSAADALGCELVYALVPKNGDIQGLADSRLRAEAEENVLAVEHSMALEDQAAHGVDDKVKQEARRLSARRRR